MVGCVTGCWALDGFLAGTRAKGSWEAKQPPPRHPHTLLTTTSAVFDAMSSCLPCRTSCCACTPPAGNEPSTRHRRLVRSGLLINCVRSETCFASALPLL